MVEQPTFGDFIHGGGRDLRFCAPGWMDPSTVKAEVARRLLR